MKDSSSVGFKQVIIDDEVCPNCRHVGVLDSSHLSRLELEFVPELLNRPADEHIVAHVQLQRRTKVYDGELAGAVVEDETKGPGGNRGDGEVDDGAQNRDRDGQS